MSFRSRREKRQGGLENVASKFIIQNLNPPSLESLLMRIPTTTEKSGRTSTCYFGTRGDYDSHTFRPLFAYGKYQDRGQLVNQPKRSEYGEGKKSMREFGGHQPLK